MKIILHIALFIITLNIAFAQAPDKALSRVRYTFTHVQDTNQRDEPHVENMLLVIGKNASAFTSYDKIEQEISFRKELEEQIKNQVGGGNIRIQGIKPTTALDYYYFIKENKFYTKERVVNNYLVVEDAPAINWKISTDTASFSGILCTKATVNFKGRNWIAWYAPALPFQSGPWKLNGLPGLIIEAYDEKKEVKFEFAGMEAVTDADAKVAESSKINAPAGGRVVMMGMDNGSPFLGTEIALPADAIRATRKEIDRLKEARDKDPQGFMKTQMAASGVMLQVTGVRMSPSTVKKIELNNPIELPVK